MKLNKESYIFLLSGLLMLTISRVLFAILGSFGTLFWSDYLFSFKMGAIEYGSYVLILISVIFTIKNNKKR